MVKVERMLSSEQNPYKSHFGKLMFTSHQILHDKSKITLFSHITTTLVKCTF